MMNRNDIEKVRRFEMKFEIIFFVFYSFFGNVIEKEKDILIEKILKLHRYDLMD
jgi:hypothetical protein